MSMASFQFELVTPEKLLFSGAVESVVVPGTEGDFEVLAMHAPLMSTIRPGVIVVKEAPGAAGQRLFVRGGFADVNPLGLTILAEQAIPVEDLTAEKLQLELKVVEEEAGQANGDVAKASADLKLGQLKDLQKTLS
jgi:F-type H+-transporting ATPase subunit epsilon